MARIWGYAGSRGLGQGRDGEDDGEQDDQPASLLPYFEGAGDAALAAGDGPGVGRATRVMSAGSGRETSTWPPSESTARSSTRIRTRLTAGKLVTMVFTTEYTVRSSAFEPPGSPDDASDDRST